MRQREAFSFFAFGFKAFATASMILTPLLGVWVASSLAAFGNRAIWMPVAAGLLLFPILPLSWEGIAELRSRGQKVKKRRFLTFFDRLVLRTLGLNLVFLVVLCAAFPQRAFVALAARGDWMLDGRHGPSAERARQVLLGAAGGLDWLYKATNDNPYRDESARKKQHDESPKPTPAPTTTARPAPEESTTSTSPTPERVDAPAKRAAYPWPKEIHPVVKAMPREAETSIRAVGLYIKEREPDPLLRVKALHDWVADRIAYDAPAYAAHDVPHVDGDPEYVFRARVGVCAGYAKLMEELGKATGDEILYLTGDARSQQHPMMGEGHAWNAAKIDGAWYLIDTTWDAGSVDGPKFEKHYKTEFLFTPPDIFANSHYPEEAKWQLLEKPLSHAEFFRRPVLRPAFYTHGLGLVSPNQSQVTVGDTLEVTLSNPRGTFLIAEFAPKGTTTSTKCRSDKLHATCTFPGPGTFDFNLYVNDKSSGIYEYAGSIEVNARP